MSSAPESGSSTSPAAPRRIFLLLPLLGLAAAGIGYFTVIADSGSKPPTATTQPEPPPPILPAPKPTDAAANSPEGLFQAGKYEAALKALDAAAKADPTHPPGRVALAELFAHSGQPAPARFHLEVAATEYPDHPAVFLLNGGFALAEQRMTDALLSFHHANDLAGNPKWSEDQMKRFVRDSRLGTASVFEMRQNWPAARDLLATVLTSNPKNTALRERYAVALFRCENPDAALKEFQTAFAENKQLDPPELQMARLWASRADDAKTEEWFRKALAADPKNLKPLREYASWLLNMNRANEAAPLLETARKLDPDSRETRTLQGVLARYQKNYPAAEALFETLFAENLNDTSAAWNLALALADSADATKRARSVAIAESEARKHQQTGEAYAVLGWCYFRNGRRPEAEQSLMLAVSAGDVRLDTVYYLAKIQADRGDVDEPLLKLTAALQARGPFIYRAEAEALKKDLEAKKARAATEVPKDKPADGPKP